MKKDEILTLYHYNAWANERILDTVSRVNQEQFLAPSSFSHGGLRGTLVHTLFAEWIWRNRWEGHLPAEWMKSEDFPTFEALRERWNNETKNLLAFVENVTENNLDSTIHSHHRWKVAPKYALAFDGTPGQSWHTTSQ